MDLPWEAWTDDVLHRARASQRPVLLFLVADWSRHCAAMEASTLRDARVRAAVRENCIPVKVDAREHPHIDALYNQGGWPSTVLLGGHGEVLVGGTFLDARHLADLVSQAGAVCRGEARFDEFGPTASPPRVGRLVPGMLAAMEDALLADFDERHGGFGLGGKFPHVDVLEFVLQRYGDGGGPRLREVLEKTLDGLSDGALHDPVDGGFFRYCERRDWSAPHTEKCLEVNAGLAGVYLAAGRLLQRRELLRVAEDTLSALLRDFRDAHTGLFHGSLAPDDAYYAHGSAARRTRRPPAASGRFLADGNARAIAALAEGGARLGRDDWTSAAVDAARALLAALHRPGRGLHHALQDGRRLSPGRLRDQVATARALLSLAEHTGDPSHLEPFEDLLDVLATRHVQPSGVLGDAPERGASVRPAAAQRADAAAAAEILLRGAVVLGRPSLMEPARATLEHAAEDFRRHRDALAPYASALQLVLHPPLHVVVVGDAADARSAALLAAAGDAFLPGRVVQRVDPSDGATLERLGLPRTRRPTAYVFLSHDGAGRHIEPATLRAALPAVNRRRVGAGISAPRDRRA